MNVIIFGENGQVSSHLLASKPAHIKLRCHNRQSANFLGTPDFPQLVHGADLVINAAAYTAVDLAEDESETAKAWAINASAVGQLAQACAQADCPLFHISTDYCYPGTKPINQEYMETDMVGPTGVYGASKLAGDLAVLSSGAKGYIFRTAWVYSAHGHNFVKTMIQLVQNKNEVGIVADQYGNPTAASDIAQALWQCASILEHGKAPFPRPGIYHLVGSGSTNWHGFAQFIFNELQSKGFKVPSMVHALKTDEYPTKAKRPANSRLSSQKFSQSFGITLPKWQDSTRKVVSTILQSL